jgi:hypothetical protein
MSERVSEITELVLITLESKPPQYRLRVKAKTGSGGISNPQLLETTGPKDKFKNLELVVDVPSMGTAMVTTVAYNFYLGYNSGGHIGVRVLAQDNDKTVLFEEASQSLMGIGDAFPWSHPSGPNKDLQLNDVVGRVVRVVRPGGLVTTDVKPGRVTVYLDDESRATHGYVDAQTDI